MEMYNLHAEACCSLLLCQVELWDFLVSLCPEICHTTSSKLPALLLASQQPLCAGIPGHNPPMQLTESLLQHVVQQRFSLPAQGSLASEPAGPTPAELDHAEQAKQHSASEVVLLPPGQKNEQRMGEDLMMTSKTHQRCEASATVQQQLEAVFGRGKLEGGAGEGGGSRRVRGRCALTGWPGHMRVRVLWLTGRHWQGRGRRRVVPARGRSISRCRVVWPA